MDKDNNKAHLDPLLEALKRASSFKRQQNQLDDILNDTNAQINELKETNEKENNINELKETNEKYNNTINELNNTINELKETNEKLNNKINELETTLNNVVLYIEPLRIRRVIKGFLQEILKAYEEFLEVMIIFVFTSVKMLRESNLMF